MFPVDLAVNEFWLDQRRRFMGVLRDITDRKRAEDALRVQPVQNWNRDTWCRGAEQVFPVANRNKGGHRRSSGIHL